MTGPTELATRTATPMSLLPGSPEWTESRRRIVFASEVALLFGLPVYGGRTLSDLWYEKRYGVERGTKGNEATALGTELEPVVLRYAEARLGPLVDRQRQYITGANGGTIDARVYDLPAIVEAKTSGVIGPSKLDLWGPDDSDEVPEQYLLQCQCQLLVTGAEIAYLAALIGGRGYAMFQIHREPALIDAIEAKSAEFLATLTADTAPAEPPQLETLKRLRRQPSKVLPWSDAIEEAREVFEQAKAANKLTEAEKESAQAALLALLGDAEAAECSGGMLTYYEQTNRYPARLASETTFRVLRFKKGG